MVILSCLRSLLITTDIQETCRNDKLMAVKITQSFVMFQNILVTLAATRALDGKILC